MNNVAQARARFESALSATYVLPALLAVNTVTNTVYASGLQAGGGIMVIDGATNAVRVISTPIPWWG